MQAPMASWSYNPTASNGPQNWGLLSAAYAQCVNSLAQSPVNLPRADAREVNGGGSYLVPQGMPALSWEAPRPVEEGGSESMWSNANGVWSSEAAQDEPSSFEVVRRQGLELKAKVGVCAVTDGVLVGRIGWTMLLGCTDACAECVGR